MRLCSADVFSSTAGGRGGGTGAAPVEFAVAPTLAFTLQVTEPAGRELLGPAISDLALFPADASGKRTAPEGFPLRKGSDPRVRVEATLDLPAVDKARTLPYKVEAISPARKRTTVYEGTVSVARKQASVPLRFHVPVNADWEDGVWLLRSPWTGPTRGEDSSGWLAIPHTSTSLTRSDA